MQRYFRELRALSGETLDKYGIVKAFEDGHQRLRTADFDRGG